MGTTQQKKHVLTKKKIKEIHADSQIFGVITPARNLNLNIQHARRKIDLAIAKSIAKNLRAIRIDGGKPIVDSELYIIPPAMKKTFANREHSNFWVNPYLGSAAGGDDNTYYVSTGEYKLTYSIYFDFEAIGSP